MSRSRSPKANIARGLTFGLGPERNAIAPSVDVLDAKAEQSKCARSRASVWKTLDQRRNTDPAAESEAAADITFGVIQNSTNWQNIRFCTNFQKAVGEIQ
jgi:hypothetical protein